MHDENEDMDYFRLTEVFGLESLMFKSVGITIGSSTSHLLFSRLTARRRDSSLSRYEVAGREVIHRSPIIFTPYSEGTKIDTDSLHEFITRSYREAGLSPRDVDTGAVIITGYAARKENAEAIVELFSRWAGKFVCATAGPKLEAILAAHGSGAVELSRKMEKTVVNVDMGGGTSKVVIIKSGAVVDTASLFVGSRVVATDDSGRINRMEEAAVLAAREIGIDLELGAPLSKEGMRAIARVLSGPLFEVIGRGELSAFAEGLMETAPLAYRGPVDIVMFSGGVAEYIYGHEKSDFGDLGPFLGEIIAGRIADSAFMSQEPAERIRATVMGVSQYSLQVSGSTIFISENTTLPKRSVQVFSVALEGKAPAEKEVEDKVGKALSRYGFGEVRQKRAIALAVKFSHEAEPSCALLRNLANGIVAALDGAFPIIDSLIVILDIDVANLVGGMLSDKLGPHRDIMCVDGIEVGDLDYIDIGTEIEASRTVPVVVKNLVF